MDYDTFNREQLLEEIADLRKRLAELERAEGGLTALKKSLSTSIEMFRALFEQASDCVLLMEVRKGEGPVIIDANAAACAMHGYERQEMIGRPVTFLDAPETAARVEERSRKLQGGEALFFEGHHVRKDGSVFPVEVSARMITIGGKTYILGIDRDITKRKRVEQALRESEERFRTLFEHAGDALFLIEPDGRFIDVNRRACDVLGYSREELLRLSVPDIDTVFPEDEFRAFVKSLEKNRPVTVEAVHRRKDGTTFPVEIRTGLIDIHGRECLFSLARNVSKRKSMEQELREERDKAQKYLSIAGVIFVIIDRDERVELINAKGCEILGYEEPDVIGRNWFDTFIPERMREDVRGAFSALMAGNVVPVEFYENPVLNRDGEERIIAWHNTVVRDEEGTIAGTLSSGEDITERKRIEVERERLIEELQGALAEIKSLKGMVPLCAMRTSKTTEAVQKHYESISKNGRCPDCLRILEKR